MNLENLIKHLATKNLSKPTHADPLIPPFLQTPQSSVTTTNISDVNTGEILTKPDYVEPFDDRNWLDDCEVRVSEDIFDDDLQGNEKKAEDIADNVAGVELDCAGWYCPFHFYEHDYGIYIKSSTIKKNTRHLIDVMTSWERVAYHSLTQKDKSIFSQEIKRAAFLSIYLHEMYHHKVESFATRLEMVTEHPLFVDYNRSIFQRFQTPLRDELIEEALATAYSLQYLKVAGNAIFHKFQIDLNVKEIVCRFEAMKIHGTRAPGYRGAKNLLNNPFPSPRAFTRNFVGISKFKFSNLENELQQTILECQFPPVGGKDNWQFAPLMMEPYFKKKIPVYEVRDISPSKNVMPLQFLQLSPKKALKIARKNWGIEVDGTGRGDHKKIKLPKSQKRKDFDTGYRDIPRKEWEILIEGMNEVLGSNFKNNEEGRRRFIDGP